MKLKDIRTLWNHFFFGKEPVEGIAVFRICFGLVLIVSALFLLPGFSDWFGSHAIVQASTAATFTGPGRLNLFSWLGDSENTAYFIYATCHAGLTAPPQSTDPKFWRHRPAGHSFFADLFPSRRCFFARPLARTPAGQGEWSAGPADALGPATDPVADLLDVLGNGLF